MRACTEKKASPITEVTLASRLCREPKGKMEWGRVRGLKEFLKQVKQASKQARQPPPQHTQLVMLHELGEGKKVFLDLDVCIPSWVLSFRLVM